MLHFSCLCECHNANNQQPTHQQRNVLRIAVHRPHGLELTYLATWLDSQGTSAIQALTLLLGSK
jgi:hypothetical protein